MAIGNTLTTTIQKQGQPDHDVVTTRNTGESDADFIDRHCRAVLAYMQAHGGADKLVEFALGVVQDRERGMTDAQMVTAYDAQLQALA